MSLQRKTLAEMLTFTRSGTATYFGPDGLLKTAAADQPRFDYDPVTKAPKGLLIEESRTNYFTHSGDAASAWTTLNNVTVSPDTEIAPDGALSADAIVENTATTSHYAQKTITLAANQFLTWEISLKPEGSPRKVWLWLYANSFADAVRAQFDLVTGEVESVDVAGTGASVSAAIKAYPDGFFRVRLTGVPTTAAVTDLNLRLRLDNAGTTYTGDGISGVHTWGSQLEAGAFPTSYIPTTTTPATRAADACFMSGTNFSRWFNPAEGTFLVELSCFGVGENNGILFVQKENAPPRYQATYGPSGIVGAAVVNGADKVVFGFNTPGSVPFGTVTRAALAYKTNDFAFTRDGLTPGVDTSGDLPTEVNIARFGFSNGTPLNGHFRRLRYWPTRLPNVRLQEITA